MVKKFRRMLIVLGALVMTGCAITPYKELNLDTTSNFNRPKDGMSGIYVYQWKTGILGAGRDVDFEIKGQPIISLNTGEYGYFEVSPGRYEYKIMGGLFPIYAPIDFEMNQNYFFQASLNDFTDHAGLVTYQDEINYAKENIKSGRYEWYSID